MRLLPLLVIVPVLALAAAAPASAATGGGCATAYASALVADAVDNGPVHRTSGGVSVGDVTPSVLVAGTTAPTSGFVRCST